MKFFGPLASRYLGVFELLAFVAVALFAFFAWRYFTAKDAFEIARDLKERTPLGIPARTIDSSITAATGREETLGGWLAELFDPATREANQMLRAPVVLPQENVNSWRPWAL